MPPPSGSYYAPWGPRDLLDTRPGLCPRIPQCCSLSHCSGKQTVQGPSFCQQTPPVHPRLWGIRLPLYPWFPRWGPSVGTGPEHTGGGAPQWRISAASHAYAVFSFLLASVSEAGLLMATKQPGPMSVKPALRHLLAISQTHHAVQGASQVSRRFQSWVGREAQQTDTWSHSLPSGSPYYDD